MTRSLLFATALVAVVMQGCSDEGKGSAESGVGGDAETSAVSGDSSRSGSGSSSTSGGSVSGSGGAGTTTAAGIDASSATATTGLGVDGTVVGTIGTTSTTGSSTTGAGGFASDPADEGAAGAPGDFEVATNPFVMADYDPLSTFAADADTASYDTFRSTALSSNIPDPTRVRLEEFVNYFHYDYPAADSSADVPFGIMLDAAPSPFGTGTTLLRVGIQGKSAPPLERKPTNLVFLVDVSGSMQSAEKLPLVQHVLTETVGVLNDEDTVAIVTYASGTEVALEPTPASDSETIVSVIEGLSASGSTAGADGIGLAYQQAEIGFIEDGLNHVILCTDGDFNVGPSSTAELVDLIEEKRDTGVTLTVLGFGIGTNNDDLMEAISNAGNGVYGNITDTEQATRYVEERMLATLEQIAKDVKLQIEFNPEHVLAYRLLGYENRAIADDQFRDDTVDAGDIPSGHRVTALYELALVGGAIPDAVGAPLTEDGPDYTGAVEVSGDDWVMVKVRYKQPGASEQDPAYEIVNSLSSDGLFSALASADADFRWAVAVAGVAELLKRSPYAPSEHLDTIEQLIGDEAYSEDADKVEFRTLFANVRSQL